MLESSVDWVDLAQDMDKVAGPSESGEESSGSYEMRGIF
jgi:hypothetical protein